jgi:nicotinamide-nucleotide adenylyltransferase
MKKIDSRLRGNDMERRGNDKWPLFIGRFQPFHLGHLSVVKDIIKSEGKVLIGIGSAEDSYLPENPFTASERIQMIELALKDEGISAEKYRIIPVRNINNYAIWAKHIQSILPPFHKVYSSSQLVKRILEDSKIKVVPTFFRYKIHSTDVRKAMLKGKGWEKMVPAAIAKFIKKIDGVKRLKEIS